MTSVWILLVYWTYDDMQIEGVFATKPLAEAAQEALPRTLKSRVTLGLVPDYTTDIQYYPIQGATHDAGTESH